MKSLESVDRWLGRHFERWSANLAGGSHPKEALEIRREILSAIRDRIEPKGDGEYVFPYQEISVRMAARDAEHRDSLTAAFVDENALETQVRELLTEAECRADNVSVAVEVVEVVVVAVEMLVDSNTGTRKRKNFQIICTILHLKMMTKRPGML